MSETTDTTTVQNEPEGGAGGETRTFNEDDVNRIVQDRLSRERAKFKDYDEIRAKAEELDKLREGEKSELTKAQERAAAAEQQAQQAQQRAKELQLRAAI